MTLTRDEPPECTGFSAALTDARCLLVWFKRPVTDADRAWLLDAINTKAAHAQYIGIDVAKFIRQQIDEVKARKEKYGWTQKDQAWHRAFGELAGLHYALRLIEPTSDSQEGSGS